MKAYILAGGKSSRMGEDKGLIKMNGKAIVKFIIDQIKSQVEEVIIISPNAEYDQFSIKRIKDVYPGKGPLSGVYTALNDAQESVIVLSCDSPLVSMDWLKTISLNNGVIGTFKEQIHPFPGSYSFDLKESLKTSVLKEELSIVSFIRKHSFDLVDLETMENWNEKYLLNLNTPNDIKNSGEIIS
jgi:molybdenum cofactor guanylyltransferase